VPASASAFACACACARILPRPRHSPEVRLAGEYRPRRVPPPASTARASTPSDQDRHWLESPTGDLRGPTGDLSRPAVSPSYAQGSYYGTNRVVAGAPGRLAGPAAPLLSTTRAAQPPGRDPSRLGSSVVRTARVSRKNRPRGRGRARGGDCTRPARCARPPPGRARTPCVARNEPTPRRRPSSGSRRLPDQHSQGHYASPPSRRRPR